MSKFVERMTTHWTTNLGRAVSPSLCTGWKQLEAASQRMSAEPRQWQVLQLPTGSGKTEALKVLCSATDGMEHPGALIVVKFRSEADKMAESINQLAGRPTAVALHGDAPSEGTDFSVHPVLVITHSAYKFALQEIADQGYSSRWEQYRAYHHVFRTWLIIDEAMDWVDTYSLNLSELRFMSGDLMGVVPAPIRAQLKVLLTLSADLTGDDADSRTDQNLTLEQFSRLALLDIAAIGVAVKELRIETIAQWPDLIHDDNDTTGDYRHPKDFKNKYLDTLRVLQFIVQTGSSWRSRRNGLAMLHGSRSLLRHSPLFGIILDATASIDPVYEIMGHMVELLPRPAGVRRYESVTLHLSTGHRVGKRHLSTAAAAEWPLLWEQLKEPLCDKRILICVHKDVLEVIRPYVLGSNNAEVANWGNMDGKNDWSHCDTAILFGLPYLDDIVPANTFFAFQGPQPEDWFTGSRHFGTRDDIRNALADGFTARSVVQAINRTRCRSPTDAEGNCEPTDLYLLLPNGQTAKNILVAIRQQMPGIRDTIWNAFACKRKARKAPTEIRVLEHFKLAPTGQHRKSSVLRKLAILGNSLDRLTKKLCNPASALSIALAAMGVTYTSTIGRGHEAYFTKC